MSDDSGRALIAATILNACKDPKANEGAIRLLLGALMLPDETTKKPEGTPAKTPEHTSPPSKESKSS